MLRKLCSLKSVKKSVVRIQGKRKERKTTKSLMYMFMGLVRKCTNNFSCSFKKFIFNFLKVFFKNHDYLKGYSSRLSHMNNYKTVTSIIVIDTDFLFLNLF